MQLSGKQVFAIFIVATMVLSILSVLLYSGSPPGNNNAPPQVPQEDATAIAYRASGVNAIVLQVFPSTVVVARTGAASVGEIEALLGRIDGVAAINKSQFIPRQEGLQENFRTEIRFVSAEKMAGAFQKIKDVNILSKVQIFMQALVSVPGEVVFRNEDLGVEQKYSFPSGQAQAFVSEETQKGDSVKLSMQSEFKGQELSNLVAFEEQNITTTTQLYLVSKEFNVASLENEFAASATAPVASRQALEKALSEIGKELDRNAGFEIKEGSKETKLYFAKPSGVFAQDLNTYLTSYNGIASYTVQPDLNHISVQFDANEGALAAAAEKLRAELDSFGFLISSVELPSLVLQGAVFPKEPEKFPALVEQAAGKNSLEITLLRKALFLAPSIFVEDVNTSFDLKEGSFTAFINSSHKPGDGVNLRIYLLANKKAGALSVQGQEIEEGADGKEG